MGGLTGGFTGEGNKGGYGGEAGNGMDEVRGTVAKRIAASTPVTINSPVQKRRI